MAKRRKKKEKKEEELKNKEHNVNQEDLEQAEGAEEKTPDMAGDNCEEKIAELQDKYLRLYSDFENYKKRSIKDRLETLSMASKDLLKALLPVLDDFDRARANAESEDSFEQGVGLIYNKLYRTLEQQGLKPMETTGKPFDPELHEAISKLPAPSEDMKGQILDTVEKGYFLKDKILRYAKVVVAE